MMLMLKCQRTAQHGGITPDLHAHLPKEICWTWTVDTPFSRTVSGKLHVYCETTPVLNLNGFILKTDTDEEIQRSKNTLWGKQTRRLASWE